MHRPHFDRAAGRLLPLLLLTLAISCLATPAFAWIEQTVVGHETRLELEPSGWVQARHQLVIALRGGPLERLEIEGIGDDIELIADAKVSRISGSNTAGIPLRLQQAEGGALRLEVLGTAGLRGGTYRFEFSYRLDASKRKLLSVEGDRVLFTWIGPRLQGGVDSAKVIVSALHAPRPPALPGSPERAARGVLLAQVLVGASKDEIELLRTHVAVGEPALWQVELDRATIAGALAPDPRGPPSLSSGRRRLPALGPGALSLTLTFALALFVGLLVWTKERAVAIVAVRTDSKPRPLLPAPAWLRAVLCALAAGGFVVLTLLHRTGPAMGLGLSLAVLTVHFPPLRRNTPRGPGTWIPLAGSSFTRSAWPLAVRVYDSSSPLGFALAAAILLVGAGCAYVRMPHDSAQALLSISLALLLAPVFSTGRATDFPHSPADQALPWLRFLERTRLGGVKSIEAWGRQTDGARGPEGIDEVRLRVVLDQPPSGLRALEVAFEEGPGTYLAPCLVLRVVEDSAAHLRLPDAIPWSRGRASEEKTAVLHPPAPTRGQLLRLVRSVLAHLRREAGDQSAAPSPDQKANRSLGSSDSARNRSAPLSAAM